METLSSVSKGMYATMISLLAREINWMETKAIAGSFVLNTSTLYSLEKLIEWKLLSKNFLTEKLYALYSLEKLIEWKPDLYQSCSASGFPSLLAREINWMETKPLLARYYLAPPGSLLAREINWMETWTVRGVASVQSKQLSTR